LKKWVVKVRGEGFLLAFDDGVKRAGFFTTRFVEAPTAKDAELRAIDLIRDDPELVPAVRNAPDDSPMLYADSIREVPDFGDVEPPGRGYTLYRVSG
jgi:hypothetical protein